MQDFNFYKVNETLNHKYYQIPQELFISPLYKNALNSDSKLLYGFLLDRLSLSIKNNWHDENGNVYLIFTRKEIQRLLHISDKTCTKIFNELVDAKLLLEKSQGKAKPKLLYPAQIIHNVKFDNLTRKNYDSQPENFTIHESENLRPNYTNNNKYTNRTKHSSWHYENERHYSEDFLNSLYANLID